MGNTTDVKKTEGKDVSLVAHIDATTKVTTPGTPEQVPAQITFKDFQAVEMLVGEVKAVEPVPNADKLVKLFVDFGERGSKIVLAGIAKSFPDTSVLVGKRYAFVHNLEPRKLRGIESQGMLLAAPTADPEKVSLVEVPGAKVGARLT